MDWIIAKKPVAYEAALLEMDRRVAGILAGERGEAVWLLEHPPLYTAGTSANPADLIDPTRFDVFKTQRGGQYTYHGPGQRVAYAMLDLNKRGRDVRAYVRQLEDWIIAALAEFNVKGEIRKDRVGVWVKRHDKPPLTDGTQREDKIAAIGVRLRKWVAFHGISVNVDPDLSHFDGIVPCGIKDHGVTSLVDLGLPITMEDFDLALKKAFNETFLTPT